jgi:hypothetical protein
MPPSNISPGTRIDFCFQWRIILHIRPREDKYLPGPFREPPLGARRPGRQRNPLRPCPEFIEGMSPSQGLGMQSLQTLRREDGNLRNPGRKRDVSARYRANRGPLPGLPHFLRKWGRCSDRSGGGKAGGTTKRPFVLQMDGGVFHSARRCNHVGHQSYPRTAGRRP